MVALAEHANAEVILAGGDVDLQWMATTGPAAVDAIRRHHLDLAIVGVCAFDLRAGATTRSQREIHTKRALIESAAQTLIPLESSKLGAISPFRISTHDDVEIVIGHSAPETLEQFETAGVNVSTAPDPSAPAPAACVTDSTTTGT